MNRILAALWFLTLTMGPAFAADWPMWRADAARTATSTEALPETLHVQWVRQYPPLQPAYWQPRQERLQFDLGYEPVVLGQTMFVGSSRNDSVTALEVATGAEKWRFYTDGPVRLAPVAWDGQVYFGSDDGCFYCLAADTGALRWKVRGVPSPRKALGNGRLISVWPARGGPVVADGRVYFAAGVWPFEGIFVHALDAASGRSLWVNDRLGSRYATHPHGAMSFGGPSPQGYLLMHRGRLVVPGSRAFPAFLAPATGELLDFEFGHSGHGSRPGSWFVATDESGTLAVDPRLNTETHDVGQQTIGQRAAKPEPGERLPESLLVGQERYHLRTGIVDTVRIGQRVFRFQDGYPGVEGTIHTMLAAAGRLFVVTREGAIYCFGGHPEEPKRYPLQTQPLDPPGREADSAARRILQASGQREGLALVWGLGAGRLAEELATSSAWRVVVVDRDGEKIAAWRRRLDAAGFYGEKLAAHAGDAVEFGWPPYLANLIVCDDLAAAGFTLNEKFLDTAFETLRPYGGTLCLRLSPAEHDTLAGLVKRPALAGVELRRADGYSLVVRAGPLPGAADYTGQPNFDERVKGPLGLLWFGDTFHHHKLFYQGITPEAGRGLPQYLRVEQGIMTYLVTEPIGISPPKLTYAAYLQKLNVQTYAEAFTDIYTGRILSNGPPVTSAGTAPATSARRSLSVLRRNPITGADEAREYVKNHGCDLVGVDYGNLITMRSGTAAYYDKRLESGTVNIGGLRSGCRNTIVPAGGLLNLPTWTGNCSCNYPVFTSLALVPMPETFEQWSAWGGLAEDGPIQRIGINFGAPGDRMTADGTLWLDWPSVGGPSPEVRVAVGPTNAQPFYRHAVRMQGGQGWPWVFASGIEGVRTVRLDMLARGTPTPGPGFSVRWTGFLRTEHSETNTFHARSDGTVRLWVNGFPVLSSDRYKAGAAPLELTGRLFLEGGRQHTVHCEYVHPGNSGTNAARVALSWSSPSRPKTVIPLEAWATPDGHRGLEGVYFANTRASGAGLVQTDPRIDFNWGDQRPGLLRRTQAGGGARERLCTVRLVFAEPEPLREGERVFDVKLQGKPVLTHFDIIKEANGADRGVVHEFRGIAVSEALELEFLPASSKPPLLGGLELIVENR